MVEQLQHSDVVDGALEQRGPRRHARRVIVLSWIATASCGAVRERPSVEPSPPTVDCATLTCSSRAAPAERVLVLGNGGDEVIAASDDAIWVGYQSRRPADVQLTSYNSRGERQGDLVVQCPCSADATDDGSSDVFLAELDRSRVLRVSPRGEVRWVSEATGGFPRVSGVLATGVLVSLESLDGTWSSVLLDAETGRSRRRLPLVGTPASSTLVLDTWNGIGTLWRADWAVRVAKIGEVHSAGLGFAQRHPGLVLPLRDTTRPVRVVNGDPLAVMDDRLWVATRYAMFAVDLESLAILDEVCFLDYSSPMESHGMLMFADDRSVSARVDGRWWRAPEGTMRDENEHVMPDQAWPVRSGFVFTVSRLAQDEWPGRVLLVMVGSETPVSAPRP